MNRSVIQYILGYVLMIEGILFSIPCITALFYMEKEGFCYLGVGILCIFVGWLMRRKKPDNDIFYLKVNAFLNNIRYNVNIDLALDKLYFESLE